MDTALRLRIKELCKAISSDEDIAKFLSKRAHKPVKIETVAEVRKTITSS